MNGTVKNKRQRKPVRGVSEWRFLDRFVPSVHPDGRLFRQSELTPIAMSYAVGVYEDDGGGYVFLPHSQDDALGYVITVSPRVTNFYCKVDKLPAMPRMSPEFLKTVFRSNKD